MEAVERMEPGRSAGMSPQEIRAALSEMADSKHELPPERQLVDLLRVPRSRLRRVLAEMRDSGQLPPVQVGRRTTREFSQRIDELARVANPTDVIELRIIIEPQLARLAAVRASAVQIDSIKKAAKSGIGEDYGSSDLAFHIAVASASRNALGREIFNLLRMVGADSRVRLPNRQPICETRRTARDEEHRRIARAIADRVPELAEEAMREHLSSVRTLIMNRLSPQPEAQIDIGRPAS